MKLNKKIYFFDNLKSKVSTLVTKTVSLSALLFALPLATIATK